ncbi:DUF362 domain-containing protein, partial [bacterium]|nr:DUF362 domain-containing protein [bacterium]
VQRFVKPGNTVLIKPNIAFANPEAWASATSPGLVRAMAELVLEAGAKRVIVADHTNHESAKCFQRTGIGAALEGLESVKLIGLDQESMFMEATVPYGKALNTVKIAKLIERSDVLINMPCAKSHAGTDVSFGLKNLMGLVWDRAYFHDSTDLHAAIAELATVIRPDLTVLDATRALVTNGPTGPGKVENLGILIAGTEPLAVDIYAAGLTTWNNRSLAPGSISHLAHASQLGLGPLDVSKLNIVIEG